MATSKFSKYGFYAYLVSSVGFLIAAIVVGWPEIQSYLANEPAQTIRTADGPLNKGLVMSAISIYLAVRAYIYYRLNQRTRDEPDSATPRA